jgi:hypothetical protein
VADDEFLVVGLSSGAKIHWTDQTLAVAPVDDYNLTYFCGLDFDIIEPGARICPASDVIERASPAVFHAQLLDLGRRYRDGTAALPHLCDTPGAQLRRWREREGKDEGRLYDLAALAKELHDAGAPPVSREQIFSWEQDWRPGATAAGSLGLVGGPRDLATLQALAFVTDIDDIYSIFATAAVGYQAIVEVAIVAHLELDDELLRAHENREWLANIDGSITPPWWPMVTSVRPNRGDTKANAARTLSDVYTAESLAPAVAALMFTQRQVADNRAVGGALWVHTPHQVRVPGWTWAMHNRVGRWGMFWKKDGDAANLVALLAAHYAEQHGINGLLGLLSPSVSGG